MFCELINHKTSVVDIRMEGTRIKGTKHGSQRAYVGLTKQENLENSRDETDGNTIAPTVAQGWNLGH